MTGSLDLVVDLGSVVLENRHERQGRRRGLGPFLTDAIADNRPAERDRPESMESMRLTVIDAFTDRPFAGNPAAVAVLDRFPGDETMQTIAREMNLSETAYVVAREDGSYDLRWFTPAVEVDLCGHATLAAAFLLGGAPAFHTRSGVLACTTGPDGVEMDLPARPVVDELLTSLPSGLAEPIWTGRSLSNWMIELPEPTDVINAAPDMPAVAALGGQGLIVTARDVNGGDVDFVSRYFAPNAGVPEDPVTGSAHCSLAVFWASRLGRKELTGYQASARGGTVRIRLDGERVRLRGQAVLISEVSLLVEP